jgi:carboxypeptidase T
MTRRVLAAVCAGCFLLTWSAPLSTAGDGDSQVVRILFTSQAQLERLTSRLDVWEVHRDEGYVVALVGSQDRVWLRQEGFAFQPSPTPPIHPDATADYSCYRTIDTLYAQLSQWAEQYPDIARLEPIGQSFENRDLMVMHLTNHFTAGFKPRLFLMANIHGRELITNETAMVFIQRLLQGYGNDPDITWMLDYQEIDVLVSANPDGHVKNEQNLSLYWRKNTHPYGSCTLYGVDLNRNSDFKWGLDDFGSSPDPCNIQYRGPGAESEPETQAVQTFVRPLFPDQRGPGDSDAAPITTTGVLITLHSYGDLVLWPWGWTYMAAPNSAQLQQLGQKLASFNGYTPQQADNLYPTNGTTDDWSYGELGIASYTFEIGSNDDGFYPDCSRYDALIQPNMSALLYAAKVARTPYLTPSGPDATGVTVGLTTTGSLELVTVQATIHGGQIISAAQVYVDTPPWAGGTPLDLAATDGAFDASVESVSGAFPTAGLTPGRHIFFVRGQDAAGFWGPVSAAFGEPIAWPYSMFLPLVIK